MPTPVSLKAETPTISCVNRATTEMGVSFRKLVAVLQTYIDEYFFSVWGTPCKLVVTADEIPKNNWAMVFLDKPRKVDGDDAEGYHDLTKHGLPLSKVFVKTTIDDGELVSVTAAHELVEMLVDPGMQLGALKPHVGWYAYETADAVEETTFNIDDVAVSDFVYPAWFESYRD